MKRVLKQGEPASLQTYRQKQSAATWEDMKTDALHGGQQAYRDIRKQTHQDQGGLCAYCEIDLHDHDRLKSQIEHFHPKSDITMHHNWALDWNNMLAVCRGGSYKHHEAPHYMQPLKENLSCDAHKNHWIQKGGLGEALEGLLLNPLLVPTRPSLFTINKFAGEISPCEVQCNAVAPWPQNQYADVKTLVEKTIVVLNLNCRRLCEARLCVIRDIEQNKKKQREAGLTSQQGLAALAQRYLRSPWPRFFTTICLCLGSAADAYLQENAYQG